MADEHHLVNVPPLQSLFALHVAHSHVLGGIGDIPLKDAFHQVQQGAQSAVVNAFDWTLKERFEVAKDEDKPRARGADAIDEQPRFVGVSTSKRFTDCRFLYRDLDVGRALQEDEGGQGYKSGEHRQDSTTDKDAQENKRKEEQERVQSENDLEEQTTSADVGEDAAAALGNGEEDVEEAWHDSGKDESGVAQQQLNGRRAVR